MIKLEKYRRQQHTFDKSSIKSNFYVSLESISKCIECRDYNKFRQIFETCFLNNSTAYPFISDAFHQGSIARHPFDPEVLGNFEIVPAHTNHAAAFVRSEQLL